MREDRSPIILQEDLIKANILAHELQEKVKILESKIINYEDQIENLNLLLASGKSFGKQNNADQKLTISESVCLI